MLSVVLAGVGVGLVVLGAALLCIPAGIIAAGVGVLLLSYLFGEV